MKTEHTELADKKRLTQFLWILITLTAAIGIFAGIMSWYKQQPFLW